MLTLFKIFFLLFRSIFYSPEPDPHYNEWGFTSLQKHWRTFFEQISPRIIRFLYFISCWILGLDTPDIRPDVNFLWRMHFLIYTYTVEARILMLPKNANGQLLIMKNKRKLQGNINNMPKFLTSLCGCLRNTDIQNSQ